MVLIGGIWILGGSDGLCSKHDSDGIVVAVFDQDGNLELMGSAFIGADPDRASSQGN